MGESDQDAERVSVMSSSTVGKTVRMDETTKRSKVRTLVQITEGLSKVTTTPHVPKAVSNDDIDNYLICLREQQCKKNGLKQHGLLQLS